MKKLIALLLIPIAIVTYFVIKDFKEPNETMKIKVGHSKLSVEIADTPQKRTKGLMYRDYLDINQGMFFVYPYPGFHGIWMRNTKIPLDILWIDTNMTVIDITHSAQPCTTATCPVYKINKPVEYILEVNAGWTKSKGVEPGTQITTL